MQQPIPWKRKLKNLLFIDLKTVAAEPAFEKVDPRLKRQWEQKAAYFRNDENWTVSDWYDNRASYYAEFGRVVCIGVGGLYWDDSDQPYLKIKTIADHDEHNVLDEFAQIVNRYPPNELVLCAHNGKEFDFPYVCRRLMVNGFPLPNALQLAGKKPWDIPHQDTLERWRFGESRHFVPLDLLAATLNVPAKPLDWTGDQTSLIYYQDRDLTKIRQYARDSIAMLVQVYLRMVGAPAVDENHIVQTDWAV